MTDRRRVLHRNGVRHALAITLVVAVALVGAACGGNRSTAKPAGTPGTTAPGGTTSPASLIDTSKCPAGTDTTGVSGDTITIGTSVAQSGTYAPFSAILDGEQAYIDYTAKIGAMKATLDVKPYLVAF